MGFVPYADLMTKDRVYRQVKLICELNSYKNAISIHKKHLSLGKAYLKHIGCISLNLFQKEFGKFSKV